VTDRHWQTVAACMFVAAVTAWVVALAAHLAP
jgi:hypothetical protein